MPFDSKPTDKLSWGDPGNKADYKAANRGQWFLGVIDTDSKKVYLAPSDLETPDKFEDLRQKKKDVGSKEVMISKPRPGAPSAGWQSTSMAGAQQDQGINTAVIPGGNNMQGGLRQHGRVVRVNACKEADCLGFAVIKMTNDMGEFRDRSNSLNSDPKKIGDTPRMSPSGRSVRMPEGWSDAVKKWLAKELGVKLNDSVMP